MKKRLLLAGAVAAILAPTLVFAAGQYQGFPAAVAPLTGNEIIPADTGLSSGQVTETISTPVLGNYVASKFGPGSSFKNLLIGADFGVNPFQRGTSQAADIANTLTYGPDRFWLLGGASSAINWSKQTAAADVPALADGYRTGASFRFQRKSANADTAAICFGQALESLNSIPLAGNSGVLSFYAQAGANFSAASSNINVTVGTGTGTDQSAATFAAGTWTGFASATLTPNQGTATAAAGIAQAVTTSFVRYSFSFAIPATATQAGIKICYTPVGTASTNDWVEFAGIQLETVPAGYVQPTPVERRLSGTELGLAQRYFFRLLESAAVAPVAPCAAIDTTHTNCLVELPTTMRIAPTSTFANGFATPTSTTQATLGACTTLAAAATVASTVGSTGTFLVNCTAATVPAAGVASFLYSNGGTGSISLSSEL